jgi:hypothetical protein
MVVVPSVEHVDMGLLRQQFGHAVVMASEAELTDLFPDCETGRSAIRVGLGCGYLRRREPACRVGGVFRVRRP